MDTERILHIQDKSQLEQALSQFLEQARSRLNIIREQISTLQDHKNLYDWARAAGTYPLMCALAEELLVCNLRDSGIVAFPFISDGIRPSPFSHCAASMPVHIENDKQTIHILLDPTYSQFELPAHLYPEFGLHGYQSRHAPLVSLGKSEGGNSLWTELKNNGYFIITPEKARLYIESLCPNFSIPEDRAYTALCHPPLYGKEKSHGRARLAEKGCLGIDLPEIIGKISASTQCSDQKTPEISINPH